MSREAKQFLYAWCGKQEIFPEYAVCKETPQSFTCEVGVELSACFSLTVIANDFA